MALVVLDHLGNICPPQHPQKGLFLSPHRKTYTLHGTHTENNWNDFTRYKFILTRLLQFSLWLRFLLYVTFLFRARSEVGSKMGLTVWWKHCWNKWNKCVCVCVFVCVCVCVCVCVFVCLLHFSALLTHSLSLTLIHNRFPNASFSPTC